MTGDSTTLPEGNVSSIYRPGDTVVFKYEGNMRACVSGHRIINGRLWIEADAASVSFLIPAMQVVGVDELKLSLRKSTDEELWRTLECLRSTF